MDFNANFSGMQDAITEAQTKAKAAFDKSTSMLGEVSDFTKGNVEAIIEIGQDPRRRRAGSGHRDRFGKPQRFRNDDR
ncbi:hypothetical protein ACFSTD_16125 [Novosphingobium colocasiae]